MMLAEVDYSLGDAIWTIFVIFMWIIYFWILVSIFGDLFRDHQMSGWAKAGWVILVVLFTWIGVLIYLIVRGKGMAERAMAAQTEAQKQFDQYVRQTAGTGGDGGGADPAAQIERAHGLLEKGAITQAEFDDIKRKALA
jgi:Phospholipase_D-nuclease N-terminal